MEENKCKKCSKGIEGYKCDMCGEEAEQRDESHACGGEHCVPKCVDCKEPETKCPC